MIRIGERGVDDPVGAEILLQCVGDAEDPAELADVLTHEHDLRVVFEGAAQAGVERGAERQCGRAVMAVLMPRCLRSWRGTRRTARAPRRSSGWRSAYTWSNRSSGSGSGVPMAPGPQSRPRRRRRAAAPRRGSRRRSAPARSRRRADPVDRVAGASRPRSRAAGRYRVGSSDVVCGPIR